MKLKIKKIITRDYPHKKEGIYFDVSTNYGKVTFFFPDRNTGFNYLDKGFEIFNKYNSYEKDAIEEHVMYSRKKLTRGVTRY